MRCPWRKCNRFGNDITLSYNLARPYADPKDMPILAAALAQECHYLVTLNGKDF